MGDCVELAEGRYLWLRFRAAGAEKATLWRYSDDRESKQNSLGGVRLFQTVISGLTALQIADIRIELLSLAVEILLHLDIVAVT